MVNDGELLLIAGGLLAIGLLASLVASRVRVPGLVLFLLFGMLIGAPWGPLPFSDFELVHSIGIVALAVILFDGGLSAGLPEIRPVLAPSMMLAVVGTILTALVTGLVASWLLGYSLREGQMIGAIVACTDAAAIFALLRGSRLRRRLARTLEGESGINDPVAIVLVLGWIAVQTKPGYGAWDFILLFVHQFAVGGVVGGVVGWVAAKGMATARLGDTGLYPVASFAAMALAFGVADVGGGSGFLAVYIAGLSIGSASIPAERTVVAFHEGLGWVAQIAMFLVLGMLVDPGALGEIALVGTALALTLAVIARPLATFVATIGQRFSVAERAALGWAGLRGAVPIVLATFPVIEGVAHAREIFAVVFFVVLVSTVLQGSTFEWFAERIGVTTTEPALPSPLADAAALRRLGGEMLTFPVRSGDAIVGAPIRDLGLPRDAVVNVLVRDDQAIPPRGSTLIAAGDELHVLYRAEASSELMRLSDRWHHGHGERRRPDRDLRGAVTVFSVRPWDDSDGDPTRPRSVGGIEVIDLLRLRRDAPGSLVRLEDGRYAVCGPVVAIGSRIQLTRWIGDRQQAAGPEERAWLRTVLGAISTDAIERS